MLSHKYEFRIDYYGKGFLGVPAVGPDVPLPHDPFADPWLVCALALERAKAGDFSVMPTLVQLHGSTGEPSVDHMCSALLAVAGTAACFDTIVSVVKAEPDFNKIVGFCGDLAARGELSYVPILLDKYLSNETNRDAAILTDYIRELVGDEVRGVDPDDYEERVMECFQHFVDKFGDEKVLISRGERYSVVRLARHILANVQSPYFLMDWKVEFEAATGMDCSSWFQGEKSRPLAVAATIEEFLEGPDAATYREGIRYFFGHRID